MHNWYNGQVRRIWHDHAASSAEMPGMRRFPMQRPAFVEAPRLVFVGMNPSFAREDDNPDDHAAFAWTGEYSDAQLVAFVAREAAARAEDGQDAYTKYYGPLRKFAASVGVGAADIDFLDLLPMRHTFQKEVVAKFFPANQPHHAVAAACMEVFVETLRRLAAPVVVVANATAGKQLERGLTLRSTDHRRSFQMASLPGTTFFLSGMLSGQRALDTFSRDRLAADVRIALMSA